MQIVFVQVTELILMFLIVRHNYQTFMQPKPCRIPRDQTHILQIKAESIEATKALPAKT